VFAVGDALVSKGERDRGERLREDDRTARERESDLAAVSSLMSPVPSCAI
jgi:hypothetical protein